MSCALAPAHGLMTGDRWDDVLSILSAPAPAGTMAPLERSTWSLAVRGALPVYGTALRYLIVPAALRHQTGRYRSRSSHFREDPWYLHLAIYGMLAIAVESFEEITGRSANRGSIRAMLLLRDVVHEIDTVIDTEPGILSSDDLGDLLANPGIARARSELNSWLRDVDIGDKAMALLDKLRRDALVSITATAPPDPSRAGFLQVLEAAHCDSGILLRLIGDMLTLMSGGDPDDRVRSEFYVAGLINKFSDDGVDIDHDLVRGQANLFIAAAREDKREGDILANMPRKQPLSLQLFAKICPRSYARCCEVQRTLMPFLRTRAMRIACDCAALRVRRP